MGEAELDTEEDFSRVGRVNAMLARRLELLAAVERMARQLGVVRRWGGGWRRGGRGRGG
jgi:intron-binding protein aquarius